MDDNLELNEVRTVAPGLTVVRRSFAYTLGLALAAALPAGAARAQAQDLARANISFEAFLAEAAPLAATLARDISRDGQARYLLALASVAARLRDVPVPEMSDSRQGEGPGSFIGFNPGGEGFSVLHWRLDPGARVRPHAHTYGNVVTLGLEGEASVENFEVVGERDYSASGAFTVRRTQAQLLTPGRVNLVNLERDYIHGIAAGPQGARGLDITTRLVPRAPTPYLMIAAGVDRSQPFEGGWSIDDPRPGALM